MMTSRQRKLLRFIIDEFIKTAEAVGSVYLSNKYRLGVSPATIRNEMSDLVKLGYLTKPHSSSGRIPTTLGFKVFLEDILEDLEVLEISTVSNLREQLFQRRFNTDELIYEALNNLARYTRNLAFALVASRIYYAGLSGLVNLPEYHALKELQNLLGVVEDYRLLVNLLEGDWTDHKVRVVFGEDTDISSLKASAIIYGMVKLHGDLKGYIGVIGPVRMDFARIIPLIEFVCENINEVTSVW